MRTAVLLCALTGCAYKPGSFTYPGHEFAGTRATIGCLDVSVERRIDLEHAAVLGYAFANRCDHGAIVDLKAVRVVGRDLTGAEAALTPYDPSDELRPLTLDGRTVGAEAIAYPSESRLAQICVDIASLAHAGEETWLCFAS